MKHDNSQVLEYWERHDVESMYDKHLLGAEISLIKKHIPPGSQILDVGCGEGEGTLAYSSIEGVTIWGADFSETRLCKARELLRERNNVHLQQVDFLEPYTFDSDFDVVLCQRFLINLMEWPKQQQVIEGLISLLKSNGKLILLEGSKQGVDSLNKFRALCELDPIPVKWHNLFLDDDALVTFMQEKGCQVIAHEGLGVYFLLTRGLRPILDTKLNWDHKFNQLAASPQIRELVGLDETKFSRLKLWVFQKTK